MLRALHLENNYYAVLSCTDLKKDYCIPLLQMI